MIAAATIEECFDFVVTARKLAESCRVPVMLLTDANLATGMQPFPRPSLDEDWLAPPLDQSPWQPGVKPYDWDAETGLSPRPIPGQPGGEYVLTGLSHTADSHVAYDPESHQLGLRDAQPQARGACGRRSSRRRCTAMRRATCSWSDGDRRSARSRRRWTAPARTRDTRLLLPPAVPLAAGAGTPEDLRSKFKTRDDGRDQLQRSRGGLPRGPGRGARRSSRLFCGRTDACTSTAGRSRRDSRCARADPRGHRRASPAPCGPTALRSPTAARSKHARTQDRLVAGRAPALLHARGLRGRRRALVPRLRRPRRAHRGAAHLP